MIANGAYGARMASIAQAYRMDHEVLDLGVGGTVDPERVRSLFSTTHFSQVAMVHHETTTGMLNPVEAVASVCRQQGAELLVDAMSSYAGIPIQMEQLGADFLVSSSNKCVQGMAGLSFVIGRKARIEAMTPVAGRSLYLSVGENHRFFRDKNQMHFTPPVQITSALRQALDELAEEGGVEARYRRYVSCFEVLDAGMRVDADWRPRSGSDPECWSASRSLLRLSTMPHFVTLKPVFETASEAQAPRTARITPTGKELRCSPG